LALLSFWLAKTSNIIFCARTQVGATREKENKIRCQRHTSVVSKQPVNDKLYMFRHKRRAKTRRVSAVVVQT
jgi:hypothetical protein